MLTVSHGYVGPGWHHACLYRSATGDRGRIQVDCGGSDEGTSGWTDAAADYLGQVTSRALRRSPRRMTPSLHGERSRERDMKIKTQVKAGRGTIYWG